MVGVLRPAGIEQVTTGAIIFRRRPGPSNWVRAVKVPPFEELPSMAPNDGLDTNTLQGPLPSPYPFKQPHQYLNGMPGRSLLCCPHLPAGLCTQCLSHPLLLLPRLNWTYRPQHAAQGVVPGTQALDPGA